jgi:DNA-binding response OmpR family regulator
MAFKLLPFEGMAPMRRFSSLKLVPCLLVFQLGALFCLEAQGITCLAGLETESQSGESFLTVDDVKIDLNANRNPRSRGKNYSIYFGEKEILLGPAEFLFLRTLISARGAVVRSGQLLEIRDSENAEVDYDAQVPFNWISAQLRRVRRKVFESAGLDILERITQVRGYGLAWNTKFVVEKSLGFPGNKITYVRSLGRFFVGTREVKLRKAEYILLKFIAELAHPVLSQADVEKLWEREMGARTSNENTRKQIQRLQNSMAEELGIDRAALLHIETGMGLWQIDKTVLNIMPSLN